MSSSSSSALILCIALGAIGTHASILVPGAELGTLYNGYHGGYAGKYNNYEPRAYAFEYGVSDPHTGDHKNQWETKDKEGTVRGSYSLLEPDGTTRIVDYIADEHGFRAVVKKVGIHGTSVESHGGAGLEATPQIAVAAPVAHVQPQQHTIIEQPQQHTIIEQPIAYKSYDGGYEDYIDLKPVLADVYTKPLEYIRAPKAEGLLINVPDQHEFPAAYSHGSLEGHKIALPQEYVSEHYIPRHDSKYELPHDNYILPQENYILPQEKYVVPQEKYILPQEKLGLPQHYHSEPAYHYPSAPQQLQEYVVPEYKAVPQHFHEPEFNFAEDYPAPAQYQVPQIANDYALPHQAALSQGPYSYVEEQRYHTPKGKAVLVESPKLGYLDVPKASYDLNVDYRW